MNWNRIAALSALLSASAVAGYQIRAHAQAELPPPCTVTVPAEWGEYKGMSAKTGLVFEDKNGTLRIISEIPCSIDKGIITTPHVVVEIRRR